jgi:hypothetical protein
MQAKPTKSKTNNIKVKIDEHVMNVLTLLSTRLKRSPESIINEAILIMYSHYSDKYIS